MTARRAVKMSRSGQGGFALVAALFVLVVLAAIGAFAVRSTMTQQHNTEMELQELRAQAALNTGIEYAAARLLATNNCASLANFGNLLGGFSVTFTACNQAPYTINAVIVNVYTVTLNAAQGVYGTPDFVSRSVTVRVTG